MYNDLVNADKVDSELRKQLKKQYIAKHKIHARLFNALWIDTKGKIDSLKELQKLNLKIVKKRLRQTEKSISKQSKALSRGYRKSKAQSLKPHEVKQIKHTLHLLNQKKKRLQDQIDKPKNQSMMFGSKSFYKKQWADENYQSDHEAWLNEWRRRRNNYFTFVGSKDETNGNQMCQYSPTDDGEFIRITLPYFYKDKFITVPVKFNSDRENKQYYNCFHEAVQQGVALSYRFLKRENNSWYVQVSFSIPKETQVGYNGVIGVDVNYGLFATAEVDSNLNYIGFKNYEFDPEDLSSDQTKDFLGNTIKDIVQRAKDNDKSIAIEDLDLTNKKSGNFKQTNRKVSMIEYAMFKQMMISRCLKEGIYLKVVNPAFTSIIGRYKYAKRYGLSIHNAAALVIARRIRFGIKERVPVQLACILQRGEASKWETIYRYKHHWSHWKFLHKNLASCLTRVNSVDGCAVDMNKLMVRFNPDQLSFLNRSNSRVAVGSFF